MPHSEIVLETIAAACNELHRYTDVKPPTFDENWIVSRIDRRQSRIYSLLEPTTRLRLFYKILHPSSDFYPHSSDSLSNLLSRTKDLTDRLFLQTAGMDVSPAPILSVDTDRRTIVSLGVEGRELSNSLANPFPWTALSSDQLRQLGEACACIEQCSRGRQVDLDLEVFVHRVNVHLRRSELDTRMADSLRSRLMELATAHSVDGNTVYVHGDLSPSNVLVARRRVSLIDFVWFAGFPGFDLGLLSYRLQNRSGRWARSPQLTKRLMEGYTMRVGNSHDLSSLTLVNLYLLVRGLGSKQSSTRNRAGSRLECTVNASPRLGPDFRWWWES